MFWKIACVVLFVALVSVVGLYVWDDDSDMEKRVRDLELVVYDNAPEHIGGTFGEYNWYNERRRIPTGNDWEKFQYVQEHKAEWGWDDIETTTIPR